MAHTAEEHEYQSNISRQRTYNRRTPAGRRTRYRPLFFVALITSVASTIGFFMILASLVIGG